MTIIAHTITFIVMQLCGFLLNVCNFSFIFFVFLLYPKTQTKSALCSKHLLFLNEKMYTFQPSLTLWARRPHSSIPSREAIRSGDPRRTIWPLCPLNTRRSFLSHKRGFSRWSCVKMFFDLMKISYTKSYLWGQVLHFVPLNHI